MAKDDTELKAVNALTNNAGKTVLKEAKAKSNNDNKYILNG